MEFNDKKWDSLTLMVQAFFKWGGIALSIYFMSKAFSSLADKVTIADINVDLSAVLTQNENCLVQYISAATIVFVALKYGYNQRKLRLDKTEQLSNHLLELEKVIDPKRSSSELTNSGQTPK